MPEAHGTVGDTDWEELRSAWNLYSSAVELWMQAASNSGAPTPEIARGYNISSIPAVLRFEEGEVTNWCLGAKSTYLMEKELRLTRRGVGGGKNSDKGLLARLLGRA